MQFTTLYTNILVLSTIGAIVVLGALMLNGLGSEVKGAIIGSYVAGLIGFGKDILAKDSTE